MSASFYPNWYNGGGGGGSTTDYNKLINKPVVELTGTEQVPDIISALDYGNYLVKGYFKFDIDQEEVQNFDPSNSILISRDKHTKKKTFSYTIIKNNVPYMVIGVFNEDGKLESYEEVPFGGPHWTQF